MTDSLLGVKLEEKYNRLIAAVASNFFCAHCGWCAESCHVYLATQDPASTPVAKAEDIRRVYKKRHDPYSKILPFWTGARGLRSTDLEKWKEMVFRDCTLCERCVVNCPLGVESPVLFSAVRSALTSIGQAPEMLVQLSEMAISREENAGIFKDYFVQQVEELEKEVQERLGDPDAHIPMEKMGARILYVPLSGAHTIVPESVFFNSVGESWTLSMFDASNFALFLGDTERSGRITERILNEARRLKVEEIVLAECGHAYAAMRWEAPRWFGKPLPFRVRSILEVLDEYIVQGRLALDPSRNTDPITYHDSCNLARKGGLFEEPRRILKAIATDFREMEPNRMQALCCGGGGGLIAIPEWSESRLIFGKPKADQIGQTGAKVVATSCENCRNQITELSERYSLGVKVTSLAELTLNAMVIQGAP